MLSRCRLPTLLAALLLALPAQAGMDVPIAEIGRDLAAKHCGACHATTPGSPSQNAAAPPFAEIAKLYPPESLEEALAEGIMVGHEAMPAFEFSAGQVDQLIAYLKSLE